MAAFSRKRSLGPVPQSSVKLTDG